MLLKNYKYNAVGLIIVLSALIFGIMHLYCSQHNLMFQNNSGAAIASIKMISDNETIEHKNVKAGEFVYFKFFMPTESAVKIEIKSTKCATKTAMIDIKSDYFFDYYHQMQLYDCQFAIGELYLMDEQLRKEMSKK